MDRTIKRLGRSLEYEGSILKVYRDLVELPDGKQGAYDFINHDGAAAIVPVTKEGKILMVRQYRNALDRETLEVPAGKRDAVTEDPLVCAKRELEEETGYIAGKMAPLLSLRTWVAFCNEWITVYVATELTKAGQRLDDDEFIDVEEWEVSDLLDKIFSGEIEDAKTVAAILAYDRKYGRHENA